MNEDQTTSAIIRTIFKSKEFEMFYSSLPNRVKEKFDYVFMIVQSVYNLPTKFVKHLETCNLYEMRVSVATNEYRTILFAIDHRNVIEAKLIFLLNGFLKKSSKDYKKQVDKALTILKQYSDDTF